jgi:hypothetical protein
MPDRDRYRFSRVPLAEDTEQGGEGIDDERAEEYRARAEKLADSIPEDTLVGGKTFSELSVYEQKSVLVNRELE